MTGGCALEMYRVDSSVPVGEGVGSCPPDLISRTAFEDDDAITIVDLTGPLSCCLFDRRVDESDVDDVSYGVDVA